VGRKIPGRNRKGNVCPKIGNDLSQLNLFKIKRHHKKTFASKNQEFDEFLVTSSQSQNRYFLYATTKI
jgi:hypothetical protein